MTNEEHKQQLYESYHKGAVKELQQKDLAQNFTDIGEGVYLYSPPYEDQHVDGEEEVSIAIKQFLAKHKDLKITAVNERAGRTTSEFLIITEPKVPCPCDTTESESR